MPNRFIIRTFNDIEIQHNTLVLCDIDDTVLAFDKIDKHWWRERFAYYYTRNGDYDFSDQAVLKEWIYLIKTQAPVPVDTDGFINFMEKLVQTNSRIIFVTARTSELVDVTIKHLYHIGITNPDVHYVGDMPKGDYIKNAISFTDFDNIIFIDDLEQNINSVERVFGDTVHKYLFIMNQ